MFVGTRNFRPEEMAQHARHGFSAEPVPTEYEANAQAVLELAQEVRDSVGPLVVVSGYRSPAYNAAVGGAGESEHMLARAVDLAPVNVTVDELKEAVLVLLSQGRLETLGGLGFYEWGIHLDVRPRRFGRIAAWPAATKAALVAASVRPYTPKNSLLAGGVLVGLGVLGWGLWR